MFKRPNVLFPVIGYLLVSVFSFVTGGVLGTINRSSPTPTVDDPATSILAVSPQILDRWLAELQSSGTGNVIFFLMLLVPFLLAKQILVEGQASEYSDISVVREKQTRAQTAISLLIGCFVVYLLSRFVFEDPLHRAEDFHRDAILCLSILIPTLFWLSVTKQILNKADLDERDHALRFANRVYYPSVFSCTISFLYGWMLPVPAPSNAHIVVLFVSIAITAIYAYSIRSTLAPGGPSATVSNAVIVGFIFISPVIAILTNADYVNAVLFAIVLAFSLGVAEVSQRVYSHGADGRYEPDDQGSGYYEWGANWSTTVLIPCVPLFSFLEESLPVWFLALYSIAFLLIWLLTSKMQSAFYSWFVICMGFLLPVWICLGAMIGLAYPGVITLAAEDSTKNVSLFLALIIVFTGAALAYDNKGFNGIFNRTMDYNKKRDSLLLFVFVSIVFLTITTLVGFFVHHFVDNQGLSQRKIWEMQIFISMLSIVALALHVWVIKSDPRGGDSGSGDGHAGISGQPPQAIGSDQSLQNRMPMYGFRDSLIMGRPTISAIAGVGVFLLVTYQDSSLGFSAVAGFIAMTAITMFGFIVNDIFDLPKDIIGQREDKFLVTGQVREEQAKVSAISLLTTAAVFGVLAGELAAFYVVSIVSLALSFYSKFSQKWPWAKGLYTAALCMSPLPMAEAIVGLGFVPPHIYTFGIIYFTGRELLFDVVDFEADSLASLRTLAVVLGPYRSTQIAWAIMIGAFILLFPVVEGIGVLLVSSSIVCMVVFAWVGRSRLLLASNLTRVNVVLGLMAVANGLG